MLLSGKLSEAEPLLRQVLDARRRTLRVDHTKTLSAVKRLANVLKARGKLQEMEMLYQELLQVLHCACICLCACQYMSVYLFLSFAQFVSLHVSVCLCVYLTISSHCVLCFA